jgi:hypothetical protein
MNRYSAWMLAALAGAVVAGTVACGGSDDNDQATTPSPKDAGQGGAAGGDGSAGAAGVGGAAGVAGSAQGGNGGAAGPLHTVGGTLAGLTGDKVVLQNNGGDGLSLDADGGFSFATKLAQGSAYAVTVSAQPQGQVCAVAKGSGTMGAADVTDVTVTCASAGPFSVGGFVVGLLGSGLVLQDNGGDDLSVGQDGSFSFATKIDTGLPYNVSVLTQPASPEQTCTVANGSGTVGQADVTNVTVACKLKDGDADGVPDLSDPFPNDSTKPATGKPNTVYAHTSSQLYTMDAISYAIALVGNFSYSASPGSMTDIALDEYGVLWGVTFGDLFVCDASTAACTHLATLPQSFNGLTMVPRGTLDPVQDALVGIANTGDWYRIKLTGALQAQLTKIGAYGGYTNAGDVFSIENVGTFGAVNGSGSNSIVRCDPVTGAVQSVLGPTTGYSQVYGLAGWQGAIFAFDAGGDVLSVDPNTAAVQLISSTTHAWWGAGVTTRM